MLRMTLLSLHSLLRRVKCVGLGSMVQEAQTLLIPVGYEHSSAHGVHFTILNRIDMLPHYTNGSTAVENLRLQTACLFISSKLIVDHLLFNCGDGPGFSICSGRPPKAQQGVNVMLSLRGVKRHGLSLAAGACPPAATEHSVEAALQGHYQAILLDA